MKIRLIIIILIMLSIPSLLVAETGNAGYAGEFMRFGLGARPLGMGGAFTAVAEGFEGTYYNPAGLAFHPERQAGFTYHSLSLDRHLNSAAAVFPVRNEAVLAISWINSSVGNTIMRDSDRNQLGDFKNSNNAFTLTFSKLAAEYFSFGVNIRYLQEKLDELDAYTVGIDAGAVARYGKIGCAALTLSNLGSSFSWNSSKYWSDGGNEYKDKLPIGLRFGVAAFVFDERLITAADIVKDDKLNVRYHIGAEYWLTTKAKLAGGDDDEDYGEGEETAGETTRTRRWFGLRTGYSNGSFTAGGSLMYPFGQTNGGIDYAYMSGRRDEGSYSIISLRLMF